MHKRGSAAPAVRHGSAILVLILCLWGAPVSSGQASETVPAADPPAVGCILPLSGRNAAYGNRALDAVLLAAGVFNSSRVAPVRVLIEDSQSDPAAAGAAVERLALAGARCIIGPLGSQEALEAARAAQRLGVPILTLTQREGVTEVGDHVFRNFLTAAMQVRTVVQHAWTELGLRRFAILHPDDPYGREMTRLFREEVLRTGGEIGKELSYKADQTDFGAEILALGGTAPANPGTETAPGTPKKADPGFQALFIPDYAYRVAMLVDQLAYHDMTGIRLLGTSGWVSPQLLRADTGLLQGAIFVDGFFAESFRPEVNDFIEAFYTAYGREPATMEALVYDGADMVFRLIRDDRGGTRESFRNTLAQVKGYPGVSGRTSFPATRDAQKDLFVLTVREGRIVQVK